MSKNVRIKESGSLGFDLHTVELYHTSIDPGNLITTVSASALTGSGILLENVPDSYTQFFAKAATGVCLGTTGSIPTIGMANENTRWFDINASGSVMTVSSTYPVAVGPTGSFESKHNFNKYPTFIISAASTDPDYTFQGWYDAETSGTLLSSDNPYTIYSGSHTGSNAIWGRLEAAEYTFTLTAAESITGASLSTPLVKTLTEDVGTTHNLTWTLSPDSSYTIQTAAATSDSSDVSVTVTDSGANKIITAAVTIPSGNTSANLTVTGTATQPTFTFSNWTGNAAVAVDGTISFSNGNSTSVTNVPGQSFSGVSVDTSRTVNCRVLVPSGYSNAGAYVTGTKTVTQPNNLVAFTFADWTGTASVAASGTISFTNGNATSVTNSPAQSFGTVSSATSRTVNCRIQVPSGYSNTGAYIDGTKTVTQPLTLPTFTFSDWTGTFNSVAQNGTINYSVGNATSVSVSPASYPTVSSDTSRTPTFTVTVPSGYTNTGGTVSGTKGSQTQPSNLSAFTFSDWTGTFTSVSQNGTINYTTGNAASVSVSPSSYSTVSTDTSRTPTFTVTVPAGYTNTGGTVSGTKGTRTQAATLSAFAFSDWTGTASVAANGTISFTNGNATSVSNTPAQSFSTVSTDTSRNVNCSVTVPAGYSNTGGTVTGTKTVTQPATLSAFTFSDWTGTASVAASGTISFTNGNATSVTNNPAQSFDTVSVATSRTVNCLVTVPSGYSNTGNTVSGTKTVTQPLTLPTFAFSDWTGNVTINADGSQNKVNGNSAATITTSTTIHPLVATATDRTFNVTITVPTGYSNSGSTITNSYTTTQPAVTISVNSPTLTGVSHEGDTFTRTITSNDGSTGPFGLVANDLWLQSSTVLNNTLSIEVNANTQQSSRSSYLTISHPSLSGVTATVNITQNAAPLGGGGGEML